MDLLDASMSELAAQIRGKSLSPSELVDAHIQRIEQVNPKINAIAVSRFEAARQEARAADAHLMQTDQADLPPLFGIPFTVKEFYKIEGLPWTGCVKGYAGRLATQDATLVQRLRAAGAILLGSSNAPEGGLWMETYNMLYGRTNNPWDTRRTCGGSSGGEGALVAAGASVFGMGSDVGGSIRIPAAFCGVAGHKPTAQRVPGTGHFPDGTGDAAKYLAFGPLARRVSDLPLLLSTIEGPDGEDSYCMTMPGLGKHHQDLRGLRVIPLESNGRTWVTSVMRKAVRDSAKALQARGAIIEERSFPSMARAADIWSAMLTDASAHGYDTLLTGGQKIAVFEQFMKLIIGRADHTFAALVMVALERVLALPIPLLDLKALIAEGQKLRAELDAALGQDGVLLHPPYSRPAPFHRMPWLTPFDFACTAIFNVMQLPVSVVPTGFDPRGLPVAVQVVAGHGLDGLALRAAQGIEDEFGGWRRAMV